MSEGEAMKEGTEYELWTDKHGDLFVIVRAYTTPYDWMRGRPYIAGAVYRNLHDDLVYDNSEPYGSFGESFSAHNLRIIADLLDKAETMVPKSEEK